MKPQELNYYRKKQDVLFSREHFKIIRKNKNLRLKYKTIRKNGEIKYAEAYLLAFADMETILIYYLRKDKKLNMGEFNEKNRLIP